MTVEPYSSPTLPSLEHLSSTHEFKLKDVLKSYTPDTKFRMVLLPLDESSKDQKWNLRKGLSDPHYLVSAPVTRNQLQTLDVTIAAAPKKRRKTEGTLDSSGRLEDRSIQVVKASVKKRVRKGPLDGVHGSFPTLWMPKTGKTIGRSTLCQVSGVVGYVAAVNEETEIFSAHFPQKLAPQAGVKYSKQSSIVSIHGEGGRLDTHLYKIDPSKASVYLK